MVKKILLCWGGGEGGGGDDQGCFVIWNEWFSAGNRRLFSLCYCQSNQLCEKVFIVINKTAFFLSFIPVLPTFEHLWYELRIDMRFEFKFKK